MWKWFLSLQILFLTVFSSIASYQVPDLSQANWDTVLFLTPYGILHNFLNQENSVLWSFYGDLSTGQIELSQNQVLLMVIVYILLFMHVIYFLRTPSK